MKCIPCCRSLISHRARISPAGVIVLQRAQTLPGVTTIWFLSIECVRTPAGRGHTMGAVSSVRRYRPLDMEGADEADSARARRGQECEVKPGQSHVARRQTGDNQLTWSD